MLSAAAVAAGVTAVAAAVVFAFSMMMAALHIGIVGQPVFQQSGYRLICIPGDAAVKPDPSLIESHPGTAADAAANQGIRLETGKNPSQGTVPLSVGVYHPGADNLIAFHIVNLKLGGVTEVLIDFSLFVSNCNSHGMFSFFHFVSSQFPGAAA